MRRWPIWTALAILLLALGFALMQVPPAPPYNFLRGQRHLAYKPGMPKKPMTGAYYTRPVLVYTFRGDFVNVKAEATRELKERSSSFDAYADGYWGFPRYVLTGSTTDSEVTVSLYRDCKVAEALSVRDSSEA